MHLTRLLMNVQLVPVIHPEPETFLSFISL